MFIAARRLAIPLHLAMVGGVCSAAASMVYVNPGAASDGECMISSIDSFYDIKMFTISFDMMALSSDANVEVVLEVVDPATYSVVASRTWSIDASHFVNQWSKVKLEHVFEEPVSRGRIRIRFRWSGGIVFAKFYDVGVVTDLWSSYNVIDSRFAVPGLGEAVDGFTEAARYAYFLLGRNYYVVPCLVNVNGKDYLLMRVEDVLGNAVVGDAAGRCAGSDRIDVVSDWPVKLYYAAVKHRLASAREVLNLGVSTVIALSMLLSRLVLVVRERLAAGLRRASTLSEVVNALMDTVMEVYKAGRFMLDQLGMTDAVHRAVYRFLESGIVVNLAERISAAKQKTARVVESVIASVATTLNKMFARAATDAIDLVERYSSRVVRYLYPRIELVVSEVVAAVRHIAARLGESTTFQLVSIIARRLAHAVAEAMGLADVVAKRVYRFISSKYSLVVSEAATAIRRVTARLTESMAFQVISSIVRTTYHGMAEALGLAEAIASRVYRSLSSVYTLAVTEAVSIVHRRLTRFSEAVNTTLSTAIAKLVNQVIAESTSLVETFSRMARRARVFAEIASLVDAASTKVARMLTSGIGLVVEEAASTTRRLYRRFTETVPIAVASSILARTVRGLSESFGLAASFARRLLATRRFVEDVVLTAYLSMKSYMSRVFRHSVDLVDSVVSRVSRVVSSSIVAAVSEAVTAVRHAAAHIGERVYSALASALSRIVVRRPGPEHAYVMDMLHGEYHSDTAHSDAAHGDHAHSDVSHSDRVHSDRLHSDASFSDVKFSNVSHADSHSDVSHIDSSHSDIRFSNVAHSDSSHIDTPHSDKPHSDVAFSNVARSFTPFSDAPHSDTHSDIAHSDSQGPGFSNVAHSDWFADNFPSFIDHSDTPHSDNPGVHSDMMHSDTHSDIKHSDVTHSDRPHSDVKHSDTKHSDHAHGDALHSDIAHSDVSHSDVPFSNVPFSNHPFSNHAHSNVAFSNVPFSNTAHSNVPFSNSSHSNHPFSNVAHSDIPHGDQLFSNHPFSNHAHSNVAHSDRLHSDVRFSNHAHSDVKFSNSHGDIPHSDAGIPPPPPPRPPRPWPRPGPWRGVYGGHSDMMHSDTHSDHAHSDKPHSDVPHSDRLHSDVKHSDALHSDVFHSDIQHADYEHSDVKHSDALHSDAPHSDKAHSDRPHSDAKHSDTKHSDLPHSDAKHSDGAHSDMGHADRSFSDYHGDVGHSDRPHSDAKHSDMAHSDIRFSNVAHSDVPFSDTPHSDLPHGDQSYPFNA